jgi:tRNA A-37 threonylcarbamoyl transferase component Bud32
MATSQWVGKTLGGRYRIEQLLGQGGMSAVFKAMDPNLRRVVAIKIIHSHLSDNPEFVRRFEEEAAAVAQLRHPGIIQVFDFNHEGDTYYMVMEFVPGETLQERLRRLNANGMRLSYPEVARLVANVTEAVDYAHRRNMIHRDIKPANIMLDVNGQSILMDFGIAKILGGEQHTATGAVLGTALYMSPEQIRGERVDHRSDIYSIGVTLFEMLHGRPPYEADSTMSLMMMHLNDPVPDLRQIQPDAPEDLVRVIERCLAKDPAQRYQTAAEITAALKKLITTKQDTSASGVVHVYSPTIRQSSPYQMDANGPMVVSQDTGPRPATGPIDTGAAAASAAAVAGASAVTGTAVVPPRRRKWWAVGGCALAALIVVCLAGSAALISGQFFGVGGSSQATAQDLVATQTVVAQTREALLTAVSAATENAAVASMPSTPTPAQPTEIPTEIPSPTSTLDPNLPTPIPPGVPYVLITGIALDDNKYVVNYETLAFMESLSGQHIHFFFNTTKLEDAGVPGTGPYIMHAGPRPFSEVAIFDTPPEATQMCALVANPDHTILPDSGNCIDLPIPAGGIPTPTQPAVPPTEKPEKDNGGYNY